MIMLFMDILMNHKNSTSKIWCRNTGFTYKNWIKHCTRMTRLQNQAIPMNQTFSEPNSTVLWIQRILIKMDAWRSQTTLCPRMTSQVAQTVCWENETTTTHLKVSRISDGIQRNRDLKRRIYGISRQMSDSITINMHHTTKHN